MGGRLLYYSLIISPKIQSLAEITVTSQQILSIAVPSINNISEYKCLLHSLFIGKHSAKLSLSSFW